MDLKIFLYFRRLREFSKKIEMVLTGYSGAWGTLMYEKKSHVRLPLSILNTKIGTKLLKYDPVCFSRIRIFFHSGSWNQWSKKHWILNPDPHYCLNIHDIFINSVFKY